MPVFIFKCTFSARAGRLQQRQLRFAMDGAIDVVLRHHVDVGRVKRPLQQQQRAGPAQFTQAQRIIRLDQRQPVRASQAAHGAFQSMAIAVRLQHAPHFRPGRAGAGAFQVMFHCVDMDGCGNWPWHGNTGQIKGSGILADHGCKIRHNPCF
jgi:hypothetical protein